VDDALYRLHAEREESYWWWVGKNRIILSMVERYGGRVSGFGVRVSGESEGKPRALDIGCGAGGVLAKLARGFDAIGIDMSPIAREYCAKRGLVALDGSLPDALPVAAKSDSFDVIVMSEVIEHVPEDRRSVETVARLLKPGGVLICTVPAHMWLWSSHDDFNFHQRRYTRRQFGSLFENLPGVTLERMVLSYYQAASLPLIVGARAVEKIWTRLTGKSPAAPEVKPLPRPVNWALSKAFEMERHVLPRVQMPWGTSVISVHRRTMG
jgi:2-polyprenyl-3-methyl-5-hydroxy-6-metoxy-1,4-benzoquinol methylase